VYLIESPATVANVVVSVAAGLERSQVPLRAFAGRFDRQSALEAVAGAIVPVFAHIEHGEIVNGLSSKAGIYAVRVEPQVKLPGLIVTARFVQAERCVE